MNAPAGWNPDPQNPSIERWWDGQQWAEQTRPAPTLRASAGDRRYTANMIAALIASLGIIVGSLGPWASFFAFTKNGVEGDGVITLVLGVIAAVALFVRLSRGSGEWAALRWGVPVIGVLCVAISVYDLFEVTSITAEFFGEPIGVQVGWGLWLLLISSAVLCLTSASVVKRPRTP